MKTKMMIFLFFLSIILVSCGSGSTKTESDVSERVDDNNISESIKAYEIYGTADENDGGDHKDECAVWSPENIKMIERKGAKKRLTISFDGKEYTGEYSYSVLAYRTIYCVDYYYFENGSFSVKSENEELKELIINNVDATADRTVSQCMEDAVRIAGQYINVEDYKVITEKNEYVYSFKFKKFIEDFESCAVLNVVYDRNGNIISFENIMTKEIDDVIEKNDIEAITKYVNRLGSIEGENLVKKKIGEIYGDKAEYEIKSKMVVVSETGEFGMIYSIETLSENGCNAEGESEKTVSYSMVDILVAK